ncbi:MULTISPECIES: hypothetical protein [unclassified Saccharicrinis]|uniref:hypothetical protein n=1 Tax=unclassified Saccharicrinis TaxID=2646859 RepID=UPI003D35020B
MKKRLLCLIKLTFLGFVLIAQVPEAFNYQAVVRTSSGEVVPDQLVSFRISILKESETGKVMYSETHSVTTNAFGLVTLRIGEGRPVDGIFGPGGWGLAPHFIKVELDLTGGTSFIHMGTSQLVSVPYAFHAYTVTNDEIDDADADPGNEIQTLGLSGRELTLSNGGGSVTIPGNELWHAEGTSIYYPTGRVGIGDFSVSYPQMFQIRGENASAILTGTAGSAYIDLGRYNVASSSAYLIFATDGTRKFRAGLFAGHENYRISAHHSNLVGLEVQEDGVVKISHELHTSNTSSANMVPIAYGVVNANGTIAASTGNFTVEKSTGRYFITIDGESYHYQQYITIVSIIGTYGFSSISSGAGRLYVYTKNTDNEFEDMSFSFVTYKP